MRVIMVLLAMTGLAMQGQLWLTDGGFRKTRELRAAVDSQREQNTALRERNMSLDAEVINLKEGREAAEERARTDLGLIGRNETFYQVVPSAGDSRVADASGT